MQLCFPCAFHRRSEFRWTVSFTTLPSSMRRERRCAMEKAVERRYATKFYAKLNKILSDTYQMILEAYGYSRVQDNPRLAWMIAETLSIPKTTVHNTVTNNSQMQKVCDKLVAKLPTDEHKYNRMRIAVELLG